MILINTVDENKVITDTDSNVVLPTEGNCNSIITLEFDDTKLTAYGSDMMHYMDGFIQAIDDATKFIWDKKIEYKIHKTVGSLSILELVKVNHTPVQNYAVSRDTLFSKLLTKVSLKVCTIKDGLGVVEGSVRNATVNDSYLFTSKHDVVSELNKDGSALGNGVNMLFKDGEDIKEVLMRSYANLDGKPIQTILGKLLKQMVKVDQVIL